MNKKNKLIFALGLAGAMAITACNSSSYDYDYEDTTVYGVAITGFSLQTNSSVLNNLDSIFFSIDLNSAQIYNADSLPYGTDISALAVTITSDACSELKLYSPIAEADGGGETEVDYVDDEDATIDFSNGPVRLHIVSYDGNISRDYTVKVNVHKMVPDSLYWSSLAYRSLPTTFSNPTNQKTVKFADKAYCLTTDGSAYCMAKCANPVDEAWSTEPVSFPNDVDVRSLTATNDALFILSTNGSLLKSTDGASWTSTGETWNTIVAPYNSTLLGLKANNGTYYHVTYPSSNSIATSDEFPVSGSSAAAVLATKWSDNNQIMIVGGRKKNGSLTGATWAYDGSQWTQLSSGMVPSEGLAVSAYTISETDTTTWRVTDMNVLLAIGGKNQLSSINSKVYLSRNMGMTWSVGTDLLQLPDYMPAVYNADLLVFTTKMSDNLNAQSIKNGWSVMPLQALPSIYRRANSRVISATESWECPYIYRFGGVDANGNLKKDVWRGVVNHFTFRPLE